ncbi:CoA transferase [bacterium]|nr:CoA transferase [bacterium]
MNGPLNGITVVSFCRALAGPYATMTLADLGAEVIKVETPGTGDQTRVSIPRINGVSSYFLSVNRGKKSLTLDLKNEKGRQIAIELIKNSDVLVENFRPGVMERLGLDYETVQQINPRIVYASISGFGQTGPYAKRPAYDMLAQGMGGVVSLTGTGEEGSPAVRVGYSIGDMAAGLYGVIGIQAALLERQVSGKGQWVDVAMMDSQVALAENAMVRYMATGEIPKPLGSRHPLATPFQVYETRDRPIVLIAYSDSLWAKFCRAAGMEEWIDHELYGSQQGRLQNIDQFNRDMNTLMRSRTYQEWADAFESSQVMFGPVNNMADLVEDPQVQEREMIVTVDHPEAGRHRIVNCPIKLSRTPTRVDTAGPVLGADTDTILTTMLSLSEEQIAALRESGVI